MKPRPLIPTLLAATAPLLFVTSLAGLARAQAAPTQADNLVLGHARTDEPAPRPVQEAHILATRIGSGEQVTTTTDADGAYTLTLPVGIATWQLRARRTENTLPPEAMAPDQPQVLVFGRQAEIKTGIDFVFHVSSTTEEGHVRGRVLISDTVPTVPTFPVTVTAVALPNLQDSWRTRVDPATGTFDLAVPPGQYQLAVVPQDPTAYRPPLVPPFSLGAGQVHDLGDLYLVPLGLGNATIGGFVRTTDDQPVIGVRVVGLKVDELRAGAGQPTRTVRHTETGAEGAFSLRVPAGTWWVAVALGEEPYMPYLLQWQAIVQVEEGQEVQDLVLRVIPATARLEGALVQEATGEPAGDACGVVTAFRQTEPWTYSYRTFLGASFQLPVVSGTYRLALLPNPDLERLGISPPTYPSGCQPGKYLVKTVRQLTVAEGQTAAVTVPLAVAATTVSGRLWELNTGQGVTGVAGVLFGWRHDPLPENTNGAADNTDGEDQGTWSATRIDPGSGVGELRAAAGDWLLAYQVDPNSTYHVMPGVITLSIPADTAQLEVNLPVVQTETRVEGKVIAPDGSGVPGAVVVAAGVGTRGRSLPGPGRVPLGFSRDVAVVTAEDGSFALALSPGAYAIGVLGPPALLQTQPDQAWISPPPQVIRLQSGQPPAPLVLQFRPGNAAVHGRLQLTDAPEDPSAARLPALVWAATASGQTSVAGRTRAYFPLDENGQGSYRLPVIQGQRWLLGAAYQFGGRLWVTQTLLAVEGGDTTADLVLLPAAQLAPGQAGDLAPTVMQAVSPRQPFYGQFPDGASVYIPAGALATPDGGATVQGGGGAPTHILVSLRASVFNALAAFGGPLPGSGGVAVLGQEGEAAAGPPGVARRTGTGGVTGPAAPGIGQPVSPAYQIAAWKIGSGAEAVVQGPPRPRSGVGGALASRLHQPIVLRIPYDQSALAQSGYAEHTLAVWFIPHGEQATAAPVGLFQAGGSPAGGVTLHGGGGPTLGSFVVDRRHRQVVIFTDRLGSYVLLARKASWRLFLPLLAY